MLLTCGVGEDACESLGLQGDPTTISKEIHHFHPSPHFHPEGDQSWVFIGETDAEAETPTLWSPNVKN